MRTHYGFKTMTQTNCKLTQTTLKTPMSLGNTLNAWKDEMKTFECHYNGAVLTVSAENKADAERYAGYILGVGKRTWLLYVREMR